MAVTGIPASISAGTPAAAATSAAAGPAGTSTMGSTNADFSTFLKLLTTQLKYQDPMSPTDPTQFVAQLAQFSQVEQQAKTNALLQQMTSAFAGNNLTQSAALIGKTVQANVTSVAVPASGNAAPLSVNVTQAALRQPRLVVKDSAGNELRSIPVGAGQSTVTFNGLNNAGARLAAGSYNIAVVGLDSAGALQSAGSITAQGTVTQVASRNGAFSLVLDNGSEVDATNVTTLTK